MMGKVVVSANRVLRWDSRENIVLLGVEEEIKNTYGLDATLAALR